ncbi:unnamed protein product [Auanema sp. JU1783]|nr:unnamed protein product [Auanema sp. JU1783]
MKFLLVLIPVASVLGASVTHNDLQIDYIELSLELTNVLKDRPEVTEEEIHSLSKQVIVEVDNFKKKNEILDNFAKGKGAEFEKFFRETYMNPKVEAHVAKRLASVLGYYLTKEHILQFRNIVLSRMHDGTPRSDIIETIKEQISKDLGEKRAQRALDLTLKDLKILYKMYSDLVMKLDEPIGYLMRDEL